MHSVYSDRVVSIAMGSSSRSTLPHQISSTAAPPSAAALPSENPSLERMRRMISEHPACWPMSCAPQPVLDARQDEWLSGLPGTQPQAFTRLGLRTGDLVIAINGTPLDDP